MGRRIHEEASPIRSINLKFYFRNRFRVTEIMVTDVLHLIFCSKLKGEKKNCTTKVFYKIFDSFQY